MRTVHIVVFVSMVIVSSIQLSLQFECSPDGTPIPGVPHASSSSSPSSYGEQHRPASSVTHSQRVRSRSHSTSSLETPTRLISSDGHGYGLDQLEFFQVVSSKNPCRQFTLRRYTFPVDERLKVLEGHGIFPPVPSEEQIVLSTHDGDVFGILTNDNTLAGIYRRYPHITRRARVKINTQTSRITELTSDEVKEIPVGPNRRLSNDFRVVHMNYSDTPGGPSHRARCRSPVSRCMAPPARLPSSDGEGYGLDQLPFIFLTSLRNLNQVFELRKYTFPADKRLSLHEGLNHYVPIPRQEHIVLSTAAGDVFAILEDTKYLAGIYTSMHPSSCENRLRVKINMRNKTISPLTTDEKKGTPVGRLRPILNYFEVKHVRYS